MALAEAVRRLACLLSDRQNADCGFCAATPTILGLWYSILYYCMPCALPLSLLCAVLCTLGIVSTVYIRRTSLDPHFRTEAAMDGGRTVERSSGTRGVSLPTGWGHHVTRQASVGQRGGCRVGRLVIKGWPKNSLLKCTYSNRQKKCLIRFYHVRLWQHLDLRGQNWGWNSGTEAVYALLRPSSNAMLLVYSALEAGAGKESYCLLPYFDETLLSPWWHSEVCLLCAWCIFMHMITLVLMNGVGTFGIFGIWIYHPFLLRWCFSANGTVSRLLYNKLIVK